MTYTPPPPAKQKVALWNAMRDRSAKDVAIALSNGSDPNSGYGTWTPLGWAIRHQEIEICMLLIDAGANINTIENGHSLFSLAIQTPYLQPVVARMQNDGIVATGSILSVAASKGNADIVEWAIKSGVNPVAPTSKNHPAITRWPARQEMPALLLDATFQKHIPDDAAIRIVSMIAKRKHRALLDIFIKRALVSDVIKMELFKRVIGAKWKLGLDVLIKTQYGRGCELRSDHHSPIVDCVNWMSSPRHFKSGIKTLETLIGLGYDLNRSYISRKDNTGAVDLTYEPYKMLRLCSKAGRDGLFRFLYQQQILPVFDGSSQFDTLAHTLIACREWHLLSELNTLYPGVSWEHPKSPGLLCLWATHFGKQDDDPQESLSIVMGLHGFNIQKRHTSGESGLRLFMKRPGGKGFTRITHTLIAAGINPFERDQNGIDDVSYCSQMNIAPALKSSFQASAMLHHTHQATGNSEARRL